MKNAAQDMVADVTKDVAEGALGVKGVEGV